MTKLIFSICAVALALISFAQVPQSMSYQAVVRNANGDLVENSDIGVQISILQGSMSGTTIYTEVQSPMTNANGLFSVEVGQGNAILGDFTTIDWGNGPFYIKTEIDPAGAADYTITGTSQLLSVPYAFYADKAGNVFSGDFNDLENKPELVSPEAFADSIIMLKNMIAELDERLKMLEPNVGDYRDGGIIVYIFKEGDADYVAGETHGIVCALTDTTTAPWTGGIFTSVNATSAEYGTGDANTAAIIASVGTNSAAGYANAFTDNGSEYSDWFLPASNTLYAMYLNAEAINAGIVANGGNEFLLDYYWSSTEAGFNYGTRVNFSNGDVVIGSKSNLLNVRPVRKF